MSEKRQLSFARRLSKDVTDPINSTEWGRRDAVITGEDNQEKFRQDQVEVPNWWPDTTVNVVAEKYFRVVAGEKENSARQMFLRVANWIYDQGVEQAVFDSQESAENFRWELLYLMTQGMYAFNSPVWFNVGIREKPQCSACFIQPVKDTMEDIMALQSSETRLFKQGSGSGTNLSSLRSSYETLSTGGYASGPLPFMRGYDAWAGATKSGGTTRRAAKLVRLNVDHPDILEQRNGQPGFIRCKAHAEKLARLLHEGGLSAEWNQPGNVYDEVPFQNANNSVGVPDEFMQAVEENRDWLTKKIKNGEVQHCYPARTLFDEIVTAAHKCGDPGMQFDTTINAWHTCPAGGRINTSNPCSEFLFLDDSACNLGSLNLMRFVQGQDFLAAEFQWAVEVAITAQEILVSSSGYPTPEIEKNSHKYRPLGLGYTNLGALLVYWGLPYDSNKGRNLAATITAIMTAAAYLQSAKLAEALGPCEAFASTLEGGTNASALNRIIVRHFEAAKRLPAITNERRSGLTALAYDLWRELVKTSAAGTRFRNAQVTLLAPTGTISFLLGCDTTGIEPMLGCVTHKKLVGGGALILPNGVIEHALDALGYPADVTGMILAHLKSGGSIHEAPGFDTRTHGAIFSEALGKYALEPMAHVEMMAAVQPFLSGAISKTVNLPDNATTEDVAQIYLRAWKAGLKSIAIYRNGCKLSQPISTKKTETLRHHIGERRKLPFKRRSETQKFTINNHEGYMTVSFYPEDDGGEVAEIFIRMSKEGSSLSGWVDVFSISVSLGTQFGVPMSLYCDKFIGTKFEPYGFTDHPADDMRQCSSIPDYVFRIIQRDYLQKINPDKEVKFTMVAGKQKNFDGPPCDRCGSFTQRSGSCYLCFNCGSSSGCG